MTPLVLTAVTIALVHTAIGVDHFLPFIALGRAEGWTLRRTLVWTTACGLGHVLTSVVIALVAVTLGWAASQTTQLDGVRGDLAAYVLIGFGIVYIAADLLRQWRRRAHDHHPRLTRPGRRTMWVLMIIFLLGPCEPLAALLFGPALDQSWMMLVTVTLAFSLTTIATMLVLVALGYLGLGLLRTGALERWGHSLAGGAVALSGVLILLGL